MTEVTSNGTNQLLADLVVFGRTISLDDRAPFLFYFHMCRLNQSYLQYTWSTQNAYCICETISPIP